MIEFLSVSEGVREWLFKAQRDLQTVDYVLLPLPDQALYHCQQAVEKSVKALLAFHDETPPKTHDIRTLAGLVSAHDESMRELLMRAGSLTKQVWLHRYPGEPLPPIEEAIAARALAQEVYDAVLARVPEGARP